jgi:serine/threonine-protein kinase
MDIEKIKKIFIRASVSLITLIIVVIIFDKIIMPSYVNLGDEVELPDVTEMKFWTAKDTLVQQGFQVVEPPEEKYDSRYEAGVVLQQNPAPLSTVKKGRRVYLTVSMGVKPVKAPHIIGISFRDAELSLKNINLILGSINYEYSSYYPENVIISQSIIRDTEVKPQTIIDIVVSLGEAPNSYIVPDVVERSYEDARRLILKAGLNLGNITLEPRNDLLPKTVISQSLTPGTKVNKGDTLSIVVSEEIEETKPERKR